LYFPQQPIAGRHGNQQELTVFRTWFDRSPRTDRDTGTPVGINVAVGAVAITMGSFVASRIPAGDPQARCVAIAVVLGAFATATNDWRPVAVLILPTWMVMNGFLVNQLGALSWHGSADLDRILALALAGCVGLSMAAVHRRRRELQERWELDSEAQAMSAMFTKETKQRA
jgi:hypothetical protein